MPRAHKCSVIKQPSIHSTTLSPSRLLELVRQPVPVPSAHSSIPTPGSHTCEDPLRRAHHSARYRRSISCPARSWKWCCTRSAHLCGLRWCSSWNHKSQCFPNLLHNLMKGNSNIVTPPNDIRRKIQQDFFLLVYDRPSPVNLYCHIFNRTTTTAHISGCSF